MGSLAFLQNEGKRTIILICSAVFYGFWDWRFLFLLYFSVFFNFYIYRKLIFEETVVSRNYLRLGVIVNLAVLGVFKYFNFFIQSFHDFLLFSSLDISEYTSLSLILPVGISFYTFQAISLIVDTFRGQVDRNISFKELALYITLFPQLVAGPIVRAERLLPQIRLPSPVDLTAFVKGSSQMVWGFFLKLCLANNASPIADVAFDNVGMVSSAQALLGVLAFTAQIFGDFAGYSLIAIGIGTLLGYDFGTNFRHPYAAKSFSDFWQRWHISLSSWLRDYLYIPLGGNRGSAFATYRNLSITMLLGGLWHGASYNFIVWGILHGTFLCVERALGLQQFFVNNQFKALSSLGGWVYRCLVFAGVVYAWIFFRASDLATAVKLIESICQVHLYSFIDQLVSLENMRFFGCLFLYFVLQKAGFVGKLESWDEGDHPVLAILLLSVLIVGIITLGNFNGQAFIYFQF